MTKQRVLFMDGLDWCTSIRARSGRPVEQDLGCRFEGNQLAG
jgi:hypothetical protein